MPEITRTQFALLLHSVPHLGPVGIGRLLLESPSLLPGETFALDDLPAWRVSADTLQREYKLHPEAAHCLTHEKDKLISSALSIADSAAKLGIRVITFLDSDYPASFKDGRDDPPPILYAHGNLTLLRDRKFAVVGSSKVSAANTEVIREFAGVLADRGLVTVTSHNTHAYQISGLAAKSRHSPVILILDRGILSAFPHGLEYEPSVQARIWDLHFDPKKDLVLSKFRLYDHWIGANARERDRLVFALSDVLVAVEVRKGGVMESECLAAHKKGREVYVYAPSEGTMPEGNQSLIGQGCPAVNGGTASSLLTTLDLFHEPVEGLFEDDVEGAI